MKKFIRGQTKKRTVTVSLKTNGENFKRNFYKVAVIALLRYVTVFI